MIRPFQGKSPRIHASAYVDPSAIVIGDVEIGEGSSVWCNTVLRGDVHEIRIGRFTNLQDLSCGHVLTGKFGLYLGDRITVGHHVMLHGCVVEDDCLIGMGSTVLDGARIGKGSLVAAGALVAPGTIVPPGSLVLGSPAKVKRPVNEKEREMIRVGAESYVENARIYLAETPPPAPPPEGGGE